MQYHLLLNNNDYIVGMRGYHSMRTKLAHQHAQLKIMMVN